MPVWKGWTDSASSHSKSQLHVLSLLKVSLPWRGSLRLEQPSQYSALLSSRLEVPLLNQRNEKAAQQKQQVAQ